MRVLTGFRTAGDVHSKTLRHYLNVSSFMAASAEGSSFENYEEAGRLVKVAARDCTPSEVGSILDFQTRSGVEVGPYFRTVVTLNSRRQMFWVMEKWEESPLQSLLCFALNLGGCCMQVCTFKLVLKNAASLLPNDDPVKLSAVAALDDLIRSAFRLLSLRSSLLIL